MSYIYCETCEKKIELWQARMHHLHKMKWFRSQEEFYFYFKSKKRLLNNDTEIENI